MFDLSALDTVQAAEAGAPMEVKHPATGEVLSNGDGRAVTVVLAGEDSERARRARRAVLNRRLRQQRRRRDGEVTAEELEQDEFEVLAACTISWSGFELGGRDLACNPENAKQLYLQFPWLQEQADAFRRDRANFLKASPTSLSALSA